MIAVNFKWSYSELLVNYPVSRWPVKKVRGLGSRQGCWVDRRAALLFRASVNLESALCVCELHWWTSSVVAGEEEVVSAICVFYVSPVCKCCWRQSFWQLLWMVMSVFISVQVSLGHVLSFPTGWTCKGKSGSNILQPWPRLCVPGTTKMGPSNETGIVLGQSS